MVQNALTQIEELHDELEAQKRAEELEEMRRWMEDERDFGRFGAQHISYGNIFVLDITNIAMMEDERDFGRFGADMGHAGLRPLLDEL